MFPRQHFQLSIQTHPDTVAKRVETVRYRRSCTSQTVGSAWGLFSLFIFAPTHSQNMQKTPPPLPSQRCGAHERGANQHLRPSRSSYEAGIKCDFPLFSFFLLFLNLDWIKTTELHQVRINRLTRSDWLSKLTLSFKKKCSWIITNVSQLFFLCILL